MSIFRSGLIVSICTLISRIAGFIRDIFISSALGASVLSDIFNIAFRLPNFFRRIFAEGAFNAAFIPIYNGKLNNTDNDKEFLNQTYTILSICLILFVLLMELSLPTIMYVLAPGFEKNSSDWYEAIKLCQISMPYLLFISITSFFSAILNSHNKYLAAAINPTLLNIVIIASLFSFKNYFKSDLKALVWGIFLAGITQFLAIMISMKSNNLMPKLVKPKLSFDIKRLMKNMIPGILGGGVMQINMLVDQSIASFLAVGSISYLAYADRINQLPLALIGTAIGTVLLPALSKEIKNSNKVHDLQNRALEIAILLVLPASFAIIGLADNIVYVLLKRGAFTLNDSINTANTLAILAFGLPAYVMIKILAPSFFINLDTKTPLKISIICLLSNIILSLILIKYFSYLAIAMATAFSAWLNCYLMYYHLRKRKLIEFDKRLKINVFKTFIACTLMVIVLKICDLILFAYLAKTYFLILKILIGAICFLIIAYYLKIFSIIEIKSLIKNRNNN